MATSSPTSPDPPPPPQQALPAQPIPTDSRDGGVKPALFPIDRSSPMTSTRQITASSITPPPVATLAVMADALVLAASATAQLFPNEPLHRSSPAAPSSPAAAPAERLGFRLSSLAGRALRSPLPARRGSPAAAASSRRSGGLHRVRASAAVETVEAAATGELLDKSVNAIRFLAIDAVEKAVSGHPGLPMGCAPMGHILYDEVMRYNPKNPYWFNRDRFVLSAGHGCMLQYALLHLAGYDAVKEEDLKQFRQWGSSTPGHPENFETPGVEVTTGPLGQGIANAVGLALAEKHLAARFNKPDSEIVDHYTYCIMGDGCNMEVTTTIGFGSPNKANSYAVHGAALGTSGQATRANLGWPYEPFFVPEDVKSHWSRHIPQELPAGWADALPQYTTESPADATRNLSQQCLNALAKVVPGLIGGSADLASSNMTLLKMFGDFQKDTPEERNVRFGVREHGMGAICSDIALHTPGLIPYCATFFVFTDYMRGAMRISALSEAGVIYVMTHDSIGLGEDGPTHQPIEHLVSFRAMPNMLMFRPADGKETAGAYKVAVLNRKRPSILALSRQKLPHLPGTSIEGVAKGGYTISDNSSGNKPDYIIMSTGSEVEIAVKAAKSCEGGKTVSVVSFVCWELFGEQSDEYKESVLPEAVTARISIEAGSTLGWQKYVGSKGKTIGIDKFGASAPAPKIYKDAASLQRASSPQPRACKTSTLVQVLSSLVPENYTTLVKVSCPESLE
ncbi:hypothetical protein ZWY2020_041346 [Hordeum vulgare]|nr:hypothetical protein ZWY2020_041346 [Hordeum vulgare]